VPEDVLSEFRRSVDRQLDAIQSTMSEIREDVRAINQAAIPYRVGEIEKWREKTSGRMWAIVVGAATAILVSMLAVAFNLPMK
jgi:hypothetical protein